MSKENLSGPLSPSIDLNLKIESCKKVWNNEASSGSTSVDFLNYASGQINNQGMNDFFYLVSSWGIRKL